MNYSTLSHGSISLSLSAIVQYEFAWSIKNGNSPVQKMKRTFMNCSTVCEWSEWVYLGITHQLHMQKMQNLTIPFFVRKSTMTFGMGINEKFIINMIHWNQNHALIMFLQAYSRTISLQAGFLAFSSKQLLEVDNGQSGSYEVSGYLL